MRYRKLDANGDMTFGHGQRDFWRDVPDAPAQAALTRLMMWQGEWFLDITDGTPYNTRVLGKFTGNTRDPSLRARILGTPGILQIANYSSSEDRNTRGYKVNAQLDTVYGQVPLPEPR